MAAGLPIERLYAWVATEADGGEGVCAVDLPGVGWMPLVGADRARMLSLRPHAEKIHAETGCPVRLLVFASRATLEQLP